MICGLVLVCWAATTSPAADPDRGFAFTDKVVLAYYYIWFDEDDWLKSTADGGRKEQLQGLHPLAGAYNSWDPAIIEKHMQQMNRARIDVLAVSWWHETRENGPNQILDTVFAKAVDHHLKITIDYEHGQAPLEQVYHDLSYFLRRYQKHPALLKVDALPVVMIWTAWAHSPAEWQQVFDRLEQAGLRVSHHVRRLSRWRGKGLPGSVPLARAIHAGGYRRLPARRSDAGHACQD